MITARGAPMPFGASLDGGGVNFAVYSLYGTRAWLLLFEDSTAAQPSATFALDPQVNRTGAVWHIWVASVKAGWGYLWRMGGPYDPEAGHRFNRNKVLLDPYAIGMSSIERINLERARGFDAGSPLLDLSVSADDNVDAMARCLVGKDGFDWGNDCPPRTPWTDTVIYETHVRGFTIHPSSSVDHPGTFNGVIEKIPYLKELGITAVELLPVQEFDERHLVRQPPSAGTSLRNYWGYDPIGLFAAKRSYSSDQTPDGPAREFKDMVKALHAAGIEVILDVVFNHSAEGNELGPTLSFRGFDNSIYYLLERNKRYYKDFTGCRNTLNCNHPVVRQYILDCLHYWVAEMHVDGFRFDLASILGRDETGALETNPPVLERIAADPLLRETKLIAEPWDAAGAYQLGSFPGRWAEWNARYRDDVRRFWRGDTAMAGAFATRICGSADLYQREGDETIKSVNFVTAHDGFTLYDLVSYQRKHNELNGEDNRDGRDEEFSFNLGTEGNTNDLTLQRMRVRYIKSFLASLLLSRGIPMILGGDEFQRTQRGNNNAYCQDNDISWYDWRLAEQNAELVEFLRSMLAFRKRHAVLRSEEFYTATDIQWFENDGRPPSWGSDLRTFGLCLRASNAARCEAEYALCLMFNAASEEISFHVPAPPATQRWFIAVNSADCSPRDVPETGHETALADDETCTVGANAVVVLISKPSA